MPGIRGEPTDAPAELPEAEEMPHVTNGPTVAPAPSEAIAAPEPEPPAGETESDILELLSETPAPASPIELPALSIEPPRVAEARSEARVPHEEPAMPAPPVFAPQTPPDKQAVEAETPGEAMPATSGIGILLVNLGTPDAAEPKAVRRYLKEFLADRRVIETDGLLWKMVLNGIILPLRSRRRARDYQKIWNKEKDKSPLKTITRSQAEKLAGILEPLGKDVVVDWAMRYAKPLDFVAAASDRSARLRPHSADAALSAICGGDDGDGMRRGVPLHDGTAPAAGAARAAGLLRRSVLHRGTRFLAQGRDQGFAV